MFSFFKKKPQAQSMQETAKKVVDDLRAEFSDEVLTRGLAIDKKVNRLRSVKLGYFNELLGITDVVTDRVFPLFGGFQTFKVLEVHGFCACVVASSVKASGLPEDEQLPIIDIYLDLWVGSIADRNPNLNREILKTSIDRLWRESIPGILRTAVDGEVETPGFPNPPLVLAQAVDQVCGVKRSEADQMEAGATLKAVIRYAMYAVRANSLQSVQMSFFQSLLELTDEVSGRIVDQYEEFGTFNTLEVHAFCASIVATAVAGSDLPEHEKPTIIDTYIGLWVDSVVQRGKSINGPALEAQTGRLWAEYCPLIIQAAGESTPKTFHDPDSTAVRLVRNVDCLAGVERDEIKQTVVAVTFKVTAMEVIRIVGELS